MCPSKIGRDYVYFTEQQVADLGAMNDVGKFMEMCFQTYWEPGYDEKIIANCDIAAIVYMVHPKIFNTKRAFVDVDTEVTPLVGTEDQSNDLVKNLQEQFEANPEAIWDTNILGRSLFSVIGDNINSKLVTMPIEAQRKMRKTQGRIVNEGKGGGNCILL